MAPVRRGLNRLSDSDIEENTIPLDQLEWQEQNLFEQKR
tara:strand:+ start:256 stop:372 length:117 start_codon:yes stop_codon:yes gene_type:complete